MRNTSGYAVQGQVASVRGFSLVELMVAIAIIGILASLTIANMSTVRRGSRIAAAQASMETVRGAAALCVFRGKTLSTAVARTEICNGANILWPSLPGGWTYGIPSSDASQQTFSISATGDGTTVTCTKTTTAEATCVKS